MRRKLGDVCTGSIGWCHFLMGPCGLFLRNAYPKTLGLHDPLTLHSPRENPSWIGIPKQLSSFERWKKMSCYRNFNRIKKVAQLCRDYKKANS